MSEAFNCREYSLSICSGYPNEVEKIPNFFKIEVGMQQERIDIFLSLAATKKSKVFSKVRHSAMTMRKS